MSARQAPCRCMWFALALAVICAGALVALGVCAVGSYAYADELASSISTLEDDSNAEAVILLTASDTSHQAIKDSAAYDKVDGVYDREGAYSILAMVNDLRSQVGVASLAWDSDLEATALVRARELAQNFSHTRPDGSSCFTAFPSGNSGGENIAYGTSWLLTAKTVFSAWRSSSGHYSNMVRSSFKSVGMACYVYNGENYYVQCFGGASGDGQRFTTADASSDSQKMLRLYNPNSGEHFYTASAYERDVTAYAGWNYEGVGWTAPVSSGKPVYRMYNSNPGPNGSGEHHYTTSANECDSLVAAGWTYEGVGWYSADELGVPLYREYNPNAFNCNHNYTTSKDEHDWLIGLGWRDEGIAWYGI